MKLVPLENVVDILDNRRIPINSAERASRLGSVPYYGATGQVGTIDRAIFNETLILLGEDGVPFFDSTKHKAYEISGPSWVNNHAHVLRARSELVVQRYLLHFLNGFNYTGYVNGATRLKLTQGDMKRIPIPLPSLEKQREIVEKLDQAFAEIDLLEGNLGLSDEKANQLSQSLLSAAFASSLVSVEPSDSSANQGLAMKNRVLNDFTKVFTVIPDSQTKVKSSSYLESGKYAVVDQGKDLVAGYTNTAPTVNENSLPVIVFGDHTRAVKYVDFPFTAGADGTQILKPSPLTNPKYGFYLVLHAVSQIPSKGYARHFGELKKMPFPLPSLEKQCQIVEKLDSAFVEIGALKEQIKTEKNCTAALRQSLLSSAFTQEEAGA